MGFYKEVSCWSRVFVYVSAHDLEWIKIWIFDGLVSDSLRQESSFLCFDSLEAWTDFPCKFIHQHTAREMNCWRSVGVCGLVVTKYRGDEGDCGLLVFLSLTLLQWRFQPGGGRSSLKGLIPVADWRREPGAALLLLRHHSCSLHQGLGRYSQQHQGSIWGSLSGSTTLLTLHTDREN